VAIPLGLLTCITGVPGGGKSALPLSHRHQAASAPLARLLSRLRSAQSRLRWQAEKRKEATEQNYHLYCP
jgi:excinuclease UvrABC ATPase subunit